MGTFNLLRRREEQMDSYRLKHSILQIAILRHDSVSGRCEAENTITRRDGIVVKTGLSGKKDTSINFPDNETHFQNFVLHPPSDNIRGGGGVAQGMQMSDNTSRNERKGFVQQSLKRNGVNFLEGYQANQPVGARRVGTAWPSSPPSGSPHRQAPHRDLAPRNECDKIRQAFYFASHAFPLLPVVLSLSLSLSLSLWYPLSLVPSLPSVA
jgi:hypothetical protein